MCRLFHNLGFQGRYLIFDLPQFSALQTYYLKTLNLPVSSIDELMRSKTRVSCISDYETLKEIILNKLKIEKKLFIATWSLSETPISVRENIIPFIYDFENYLIAYQDKFGEVDNVE